MRSITLSVAKGTMAVMVPFATLRVATRSLGPYGTVVRLLRPTNIR